MPNSLPVPELEDARHADINRPAEIPEDSAVFSPAGISRSRFDHVEPGMREASDHARRPNLDLIRVTAILMVIIYHTTDFLRGVSNRWADLFECGALGVDLFFVLSGFLIGGLYWREREEFGDVRILPFMGRRILRTVPPYFVALILSWGAVFATRREPFDVGYLLFLQNYYHRIPYFLISWSLCVEEHFYLLFPFGMFLLSKMSSGTRVAALTVLSLVPFLFRLSVPASAIGGSLGATQVATHLRCEGLILGVLAAMVASSSSKLLRHASTWFIPSAVLVAAACSTKLLLSAMAFYRFGHLFVAAAASVCILLGDTASPAVPGRMLVRRIAEMSYSLYLTHAIAIHVCRIVCLRVGITSEVVTWLCMIAGIFLAGWTFYVCVERPAIRWRDRLIPKRRPAAGCQLCALGAGA